MEGIPKVGIYLPPLSLTTDTRSNCERPKERDLFVSRWTRVVRHQTSYTAGNFLSKMWYIQSQEAWERVNLWQTFRQGFRSILAQGFSKFANGSIQAQDLGVDVIGGDFLAVRIWQIHSWTFEIDSNIVFNSEWIVNICVVAHAQSQEMRMIFRGW